MSKLGTDLRVHVRTNKAKREEQIVLGNAGEGEREEDGWHGAGKVADQYAGMRRAWPGCKRQQRPRTSFSMGHLLQSASSRSTMLYLSYVCCTGYG